jgi:hypothetical protein
VLSRRICDPITMILPGDDAVDPSSDFVAYFDGSDGMSAVCDESKLTLVDGRVPSRFHLRPLTHRQRIAAHTYELMSFAQQLFVVRCALVRASGYSVNGVPVAEPERKKAGDLGELVTEEWLLTVAALTDDDIGALAIAALAISENKRPLLNALGPLYGARASAQG